MGIRITLAFIALAFIATGCTMVSGNTALVGKRRPAVDPSRVQIYETEPPHYEVIAQVSAQAGHDFRTQAGVRESALKRLRREAANVGANGLIVENISDREWIGYTHVHGTAIYVLEKPKEPAKPRKENLVVSNDRPGARW